MEWTINTELTAMFQAVIVIGVLTALFFLVWDDRRFFRALFKPQGATVAVWFKWDNETAPEEAGYALTVGVRNLGPGNADVTETYGEVFNAALMPTTWSTRDFDDVKVRPFHTIFPAGEGRDIYSLKMDDCTDETRVRGFVRWTDAVGKWEYPFLVQSRAYPKMNEHHFTQIDLPGWNEARRI